MKVESVNLAECPVTEEGLTALSGLTHLKSLNLTRLGHLRYGSPLPALSDAALEPLRKLTELRTLTLSGNRITDAGLALIAQLPNLENLDLDATEVTDAGLLQFRGHKMLKTLSLGGSRVTPRGARELETALPGLQYQFQIDPEVAYNLENARRSRR
jgi:Leucine-rich repeat (LRR) protein